MRCEGYRRYGGALTMGKPVWEQCKNDAVVMLTIAQEESLPACLVCWEEAEKTESIQVTKVDVLTTGGE